MQSELAWVSAYIHRRWPQTPRRTHKVRNLTKMDGGPGDAPDVGKGPLPGGRDGIGEKIRVVIVPGNGGGDVWDSNW